MKIYNMYQKIFFALVMMFVSQASLAEVIIQTEAGDEPTVNSMKIELVYDFPENKMKQRTAPIRVTYSTVNELWSGDQLSVRGV